MNCGVIDQTNAVCENFMVYRGANFKSTELKFYTDSTKTTPLDITGSTYIAEVSLGGTIRITLTPTITAPNILTLSTGLIT